MYKKMGKAFFVSLLAIAVFLSSNVLSACATEITTPDSNTLEEMNDIAPATWAVETGHNNLEIIKNADTGEVIARAFCFDENGELVELDLHEYACMLNASSFQLNKLSNLTNEEDLNTSVDNSARAIMPYYEFEPNSSFTTLGDPIKVSADIMGPGSISVCQSVTITETFGGSASVDGNIKDLIRLGASFTWNKSIASKSELAYSLGVDPGKYGHVNFRPYLNVVQGDLYYIVTYPYKVEKTFQGTVWGKSPVKLPGTPAYCDGTYEVGYYY